MTPSIYIVDDEAPARARLATLLADIAADCPHTVVGEAALPQAALDEIAALRPDIVLLDVQMPGMSGLELAARLSKDMPEPPAVVFVSAFDDYALHAFEVQARDYLLKPVRAERLAQALRRAAAMRSPVAASLPAASPAPASRRHFSVQMRGRLLLVPVDDVLYLKADLKYVALRTATQTHLIEESLVSLEEEFADRFVRVHRNALAAMHAIVGVERGKSAESDAEKPHDGWEVLLAGIDERLPISRRQWPALKALVK